MHEEHDTGYAVAPRVSGMGHGYTDVVMPSRSVHAEP